MVKPYEIFHCDCRKTIELALELVEDAFPSEDLHQWLPEKKRGEWVERFGLFYLVFLNGEFRGYFCIVSHPDGAFLHFGTTGKRYAARDVVYCLQRAQSIAANVYGFSELFCEIDPSGIIAKLATKLGFSRLNHSNTYSIKYYGIKTES